MESNITSLALKSIKEEEHSLRKEYLKSKTQDKEYVVDKMKDLNKTVCNLVHIYENILTDLHTVTLPLAKEYREVSNRLVFFIKKH